MHFSALILYGCRTVIRLAFWMLFLYNCEFFKLVNTLACISVGLGVSERSLRALVMRYADRQNHIRFNDFVACFIKLKTMMSKLTTGFLWWARYHPDGGETVCPPTTSATSSGHTTMQNSGFDFQHGVSYSNHSPKMHHFALGADRQMDHSIALFAVGLGA